MAMSPRFSLRTRAHTTVLVEERGVTSPQILEQIIDIFVPLVVEEKCCRQEDLAGAQESNTSRTRWGSRSTQQVLDVSLSCRSRGSNGSLGKRSH